MKTSEEFDRFSDRCIDRYKLAFLEALGELDSSFTSENSKKAQGLSGTNNAVSALD